MEYYFTSDAARVFSLAFGLLWMLLVIFCLLHIYKNQLPFANKLIWTVIVLVAPLIGCIFYLALGRRKAREHTR